MSNSITCEWCGAVVEGTDLDTFADAFLAHVRSVHSDFPYPDQAVRNYAEATQRLTGGTERLDTIGAVTVERVDRERIDDWLDFFDHDATAGTPQFGACYCSEPHVLDPKVPPADQPPRTTRENRDTMIALLEQGRSFGYLAYVDAKPAAWVNASAAFGVPAVPRRRVGYGGRRRHRHRVLHRRPAVPAPRPRRGAAREGARRRAPCAVCAGSRPTR